MLASVHSTEQNLAKTTPTHRGNSAPSWATSSMIGMSQISTVSFDSLGRLPVSGTLPRLHPLEFRSSAASSSSETNSQQADEEVPQLRKSCDYCVKMKRGCDGGMPCELCRRRKKQCIRSVKKRSGPAKGTKYCKRRARKAVVTSTGPRSSSRSAVSMSKVAARKPHLVAKSDLKIKQPCSQHRQSPKLVSPHPVVRGRANTYQISPQLHSTSPLSLSASAAAGMPLLASSMMDAREESKSMKPKREQDTGNGKSVPFAAADDMQASCARWTERRREATDGSTGSRSTLPFSFSMGKARDCTITSAAMSCSNDVTVAKEEFMAPQPMPNISAPQAAPFHRTLPSSTGSHTTDLHGTSAQDEFPQHLDSDRRGSSNSYAASHQHAAKIVGARRSSLEEALYGTLHRKSSFTSWLESQDFEFDSNCMVGLLWNRRSLTDGLLQDNARSFAEPGEGEGYDSNVGLFSSGSSGFLRRTPSLPQEDTQAFVYESAASMAPPATSLWDGAGGGPSSLCDLLLEK